MTEQQKQAIALIEKQQASLREGSCVWMVGEQLKEICRNEPASAELLANDLQVKEMDLSHAERKLYEYGRELSEKNKSEGVGISLLQAEKVLRDFYKLPDKPSAQQSTVIHESGSSGRPEIVNLEDFFA